MTHREDRKRGEQYLYGCVGGVLNIIFWIVLVFAVAMWLFG